MYEFRVDVYEHPYKQYQNMRTGQIQRLQTKDCQPISKLQQPMSIAIYLNVNLKGDEEIRLKLSYDQKFIEIQETNQNSLSCPLSTSSYYQIQEGSREQLQGWQIPVAYPRGIHVQVTLIDIKNTHLTKQYYVERTQQVLIYKI
jgi:hypothetical protein